MEALATGFFEWLQQLDPFWLYAAIFLIAYLENVVPPIPGDLVVVLGGYLVGIGKLEMVWVILLAALGGTLGFMTMYALGYRLGLALLEPERFRWLPKAKIQRALEYVRRWGYGVVAVNRFLSGLRSVISISVGIAHLRPFRVLLLSAFSSTVWVSLLAWLGYVAGVNWPVVGHYLKVYGQIITAIILLLAAVLVIRYFWKRRKGEKRHPTS